MAVPRPLLLSLLGTVLLAVTFMTMRNSQSTSTKAASPVVHSQPAATPKATQPAKPAQPTLLDGQAAVRAVISPGTPLKSARFSMRLETQELAGRREHDFATAAGSFEGASGQRSFDVKSSLLDNGKRSSARLLSAGGAVFVFNSGQAYRVSPKSMKLAVTLRKALTGSGDQAAAKLPTVDPAPWVKHLKVVDGGKVGGAATTRVSGTVNPKAMAKDLKKLFKTAAAAGPLPVSLPHGFSHNVERAFKSSKLDAYVGTQDKVLRKLRISVSGVQPKSVLQHGETARWRTTLTMNMSKVNQPQQIVAPKQVAKKALAGKAARSAQNLFIGTAIVMDPPGGLAQTGINVLRLSAIDKATRVPNKVDRALNAHKRVVLFFRQTGADDDSTASAVNALRKRTKALVVSDTVNNLASYGAVVQSVGVARAPSVVIIGKSGRARLIEGYIDSEALAQEVADTR
jgi:hypothetical protein